MLVINCIPVDLELFTKVLVVVLHSVVSLFYNRFRKLFPTDFEVVGISLSENWDAIISRRESTPLLHNP